MHKEFMLVALEQAWLGRGICAPNPSVGAVLVHEQKIIAKSFHPGVGLPHAEQLVLEQLPENLTDITLYVTLEPCNHWGRTPPCVDVIISHKIRRVVFAFCDPNPVVAKNDTPLILQKQGIEVIHFPLPEVDLFYRSYQYWFHTKRPWITAKIAQTLDGKIAGEGGQRVLLSNEACGWLTHENRLHADVILTTARTVLADNPSLDARYHGQSVGKKLAVLDQHLQLTGSELIFTRAAHIHIFHDAAQSIEKPIVNCTYHAIPVQQGRLDLSAVIRCLGECGYHDVWVEAGGQLFTALHVQELVNTSYFYIIPKLLGENAVSAYHNEFIFEKNKHQINWQALADNMVMRVDWEVEGMCLQD